MTDHIEKARDHFRLSRKHSFCDWGRVEELSKAIANIILHLVDEQHSAPPAESPAAVPTAEDDEAPSFGELDDIRADGERGVKPTGTRDDIESAKEYAGLLAVYRFAKSRGEAVGYERGRAEFAWERRDLEVMIQNEHKLYADAMAKLAERDAELVTAREYGSKWSDALQELAQEMAKRNAVHYGSRIAESVPVVLALVRELEAKLAERDGEVERLRAELAASTPSTR